MQFRLETTIGNEKGAIEVSKFDYISLTSLFSAFLPSLLLKTKSLLFA